MKARITESSAYNFKMTEIYNFNTQKTEQADYWLSQPAEVIHKLRYSLREDRKGYGCPCCKTPVILKFSQNHNPFFAHLKREEGVKCYICDESMYPEERKIQAYNTKKETPEHKRLIQVIADLIKSTPGVNPRDVKIEKNKSNKAISHEWKRPDIQCVYGKSDLVFEIQLCKTWLSDIVARDTFYKKINTFIFWIFNRFDVVNPSKNITQADIFYNNPEINIFVFDEKAETISHKTNELHLNCLYQVPIINLEESKVECVWESKMVTLKDLQFDTGTYKPYFFPFVEQRTLAINQLKAFRHDKQFVFDTSVRMKVNITDYRFKIVPANSALWSDKFWLQLLFQGNLSKNYNNLIKRINHFRRLGLPVDETIIGDLENKGLIYQMPDNISQVHYEVRNIAA